MTCGDYKEQQGYKPQAEDHDAYHRIRRGRAYPWKITTDDGTEWHAATETEAAGQLLVFVTQRAQLMEALPALPDGPVII
jgi:hypothetical protein